jgi:hypothetical protein
MIGEPSERPQLRREADICAANKPMARERDRFAVSGLFGSSNRGDLPLDFVRNACIGVHVSRSWHDQPHAPIG